MNLDILTSAEKKKILADLEKNFGISKLPFMLLRFGKGKIRGFSGSLSRDEILKISKKIRIELVGLYLLREESDAYRISHDGLFAFKDASKNVIEISNEDADKWLRGQEIEIKGKEKWILLRNTGDLIGCGKVKEGKVINFVPKERRLR